MAVVRLKGINKVRKRMADGRVETIYYAWRGKGAPRLEGHPGSPEFVASYTRAVAERRAPKIADNLSALVGRYKADPEFKNLAESTRAEWMRWLDRIAQDRDSAEGELDIGGLPLKALEDRRARADLLDWRNQWADRPRSADYAMQVLSRLLAFGVDRGELSINIAAGVSQLYEGSRADQIWTEAERARFRAAAPSPEVGFAVELACLTGLRLSDLVRVADPHVGDLAISLPTGKSRGRRIATVPLLPETRQLLEQIRAQRDRRHAKLVANAVRKKRPEPPKAITLLSNTRGRPWSTDGLEHQVVDTKAKAQIDKHLHDARGTFATRLRKAGLSASEIADVLGWEEERVERLLKTYVDQDSIVRSIAERLNRRDGE